MGHSREFIKLDTVCAFLNKFVGFFTVFKVGMESGIGKIGASTASKAMSTYLQF